MPLRDHFRAPLDEETSWEGLHGQWPAMIVIALSRKLPPRYVAAPRVHHGSAVEIDVATYEKDEPAAAGHDGGATATAVWSPPNLPSLSLRTSRPWTSMKCESTTANVADG
jgi:hypothetical protein